MRIPTEKVIDWSKVTKWYDKEKFSVTVFPDPYDKKVFHVSVSVIPKQSNGRYKISRVTVQEDGASVLLVKEGRGNEV